jgi:hypothetical protein
MLDDALKFVKESGTEYLAKELVKVRATDCMPQIRKSVLEMAGELEPAELKIACEIKDLKLISLVAKSLEDPDLNRTALTTLHQVIVNAKQSQSKEALKQVDACFESSKALLINKVLPTGDS